MIRAFVNKLSRRKEVVEGGRISLSNFRGLPFNNKVGNLVRMFELRDWFIQNSPSHRVSLKYSSEMADLHHELNYVTSRIALGRLLVFLLLVFAWKSIETEKAHDWRDKFDTKYSNKTYGSLEEGASEGGTDDD